MARLKLDLPDAFRFSTDIAVHVGYVNYAGHLGNDSVLTIANEARIRFLAKLGYTEMDVEGLGMITADAAVTYSAEAFQGDMLTVDVGCADFTGKGCDICYRLRHKADGREVARAKTGIVFFDHATRRPAEVPQAFIKRAGSIALPAQGAHS